jgi:hypothetical protein
MLRNKNKVLASLMAFAAVLFGVAVSLPTDGVFGTAAAAVPCSGGGDGPNNGRRRHRTATSSSALAFAVPGTPTSSLGSSIITARLQQQRQPSRQQPRPPTVLFDKKTKKASAANANGKGGGAGFGSSSSALRPPEPSRALFPYTGTVRPGRQSPQRVVVDEAIAKPD